MVDETISTLIIRTKLHRPPVAPDILPRARLLEHLKEDRQRLLSLISAPGGFGKSTLASRWLGACDCPSAWLSLDEDENDLRLFLSYFVTAIQGMFPDAVPKTQALVNASTLPPLRVLAGSLVSELDLIKQDFILALDDYQCIHERAVHDLLTELLRHPPQHMHLALLTRRDPPLPISTLRARGQVAEIRAQDLRFTASETAAYLKHLLGDRIDEPTAAAWAEKTEGWVSGLRLAALAMRHRGDVKNMLSEQSGGAQYVTEYLFTEVLSDQPPRVRDYLLSTAILGRFCAPLCDALRGPDVELGPNEIDSWKFIALLKQENMFIISLDAENRWFRYHHLFHQLLRNQLERYRSPEEIVALHSRASVWFAENGLTEEALQHALTGDDIPHAVALVERDRHDLMNEEQWNRMERILGLFPDQIVEKHPELLMMKAWISYKLFRHSEMAEILDRVESLIAAVPSETDKFVHLRGEIDALRGNQYYFEADGQRALSYEQRALERLPHQYSLALGLATLIHCTARQMIGDRAGALEIVFGRIAEDTPKIASFHSRELFGLCFVHWMEGELSTLLRIADQNLKHAQKWHLVDSRRGSNYFIGITCYHLNDLTSAENYLAPVVEDLYVGHAFAAIHSCYALALVYQNQGRTEKALEMAESATAFALQSQNTYIIMTTRAFEAELALRQGRLSEARHWAQQFNPEPFRSMPWFYVPQLTLAKVLLAEGTTESLHQAANLLERLHDFVVSIHNTRFRIDVLALQALLHDARGEEPAAMEKLAESLAPAEPGGFIRAFVDLGPPMADLLKRLIKKNVAVEYIDRLLAAFRDDEQVVVPEAPVSQAIQEPPVSPQSLGPPPVSASAGVQPLVEPLTNRELDVLELLAQRMQNKEIAEKLCISPETVKAHLKNIFQKLMVSTRRQAITRAKALGILTHL